jgi:2-(1,2-epoxy-1,2-dihydrophenyl)acetyl-CoA isomerase
MEEKFQFLRIRQEDNIAVITLNRPEKLNALHDGLLSEIGTALDGMRDDDTIRVVIVTGAGDAFCSGADLREYEPTLLEVAAKGAHAIPKKIWDAQVPIRAIINVGKPVIAMVNGISLGSGMDLALACDIRTGCEKSRFMSGFARMGLIHGMGQLWTLPRIVGFAKAAELVYTCDFVDAEEAYRIGLLNQLWPSAELEKKTMGLARRIASKPPLAIKLDRLLMLRGLSTDFETSLEAVRIGQSITGLSKDHPEAWHALLEKRPGVFKGE